MPTASNEGNTKKPPGFAGGLLAFYGALGCVNRVRSRAVAVVAGSAVAAACAEAAAIAAGFAETPSPFQAQMLILAPVCAAASIIIAAMTPDAFGSAYKKAPLD